MPRECQDFSSTRSIIYCTRNVVHSTGKNVSIVIVKLHTTVSSPFPFLSLSLSLSLSTFYY